MNAFDKWVTKKNVLRVSGGLLFLQIVGGIYIYIVNQYCFGGQTFCSEYIGNIGGETFVIIFLTLINIPIFISSLITYPLRDAVFKVWTYFTLFWLVASPLVLLGISNEGAGSGWPTERAVATLYAPLFYAAASLIVILVTSLVVYLKRK